MPYISEHTVTVPGCGTLAWWVRDTEGHSPSCAGLPKALVSCVPEQALFCFSEIEISFIQIRDAST